MTSGAEGLSIGWRPEQIEITAMGDGVMHNLGCRDSILL
jgi:hypothetical protein